MTSRWSSSETSLEELLELGRRVPRLPDAVRQRVLARASMASLLEPLSPPRTVSVMRARSPRYAAMCAAAALAVGLAGTVYALSGRWAPSRPASDELPSVTQAGKAGAAAPSNAVPSSAPRAPSVPARAEPEALPAPSANVERVPRRARPDAPSDDTYHAELGLMRSAHNAYAAHEFANALVLVSEHARRFPRGLLAEEREALRVRCLRAAGRTNEAERAATDFPKRFPRSVLVPRIQAEVRSPDE